MRVHGIQLETSSGESLDARRARAAALVAAQAGADLVVLPELWLPGGFVYRTFADSAEALDGPTVAALAGAARTSRAWVHGGSFVERASDGRLFNTSVLLRPDGSLAATYRKVHLFGFSGGEGSVLAAGEALVTTDLDGTVVGLTTCYDLRFPELYRALVDRGVELFLVPAAWPAKRVGHWSLLAQARAVEDQAFVVGVNGCGEQDGLVMGGRSLVVDPRGEVLAEGGPDETVLVADLDLAEVGRWRERFPVLADRVVDAEGRLRPSDPAPPAPPAPTVPTGAA
jgi:predicted amidohydrolase